MFGAECLKLFEIALGVSAPHFASWAVPSAVTPLFFPSNLRHYRPHRLLHFAGGGHVFRIIHDLHLEGKPIARSRNVMEAVGQSVRDAVSVHAPHAWEQNPEDPRRE